MADLTADGLATFLDEIGKVPLLTAAEEVDLAQRIEAARTELEGLLGREPTVDELATESGLRADQVREVQDAARVVTSLDIPVGEEGGAVLGDLLAGESGLEESIVVSLQARDVHDAIASLPEPHRTIIRRRYGFDGDPVGRYRLGRELRMADKTVAKLEREAIEMLALRRELSALRPPA